MPGCGGRIVDALGDSTSLLWDSVVTSPVATSRSRTVFISGAMPITSQRVRTLITTWLRNVFSLATGRLDSFSITPPM